MHCACLPDRLGGQEASSKYLRNVGVIAQVDYLKHWNRDNAKDVTTDDFQVTFGVSWKL